MAQRIEHEDFGAVHFLQLPVGNVVEVGEVGEITDAKTKDGQFMVHHFDGREPDTQHLEGFVHDFGGPHVRNAGVFMLGKDVGKFPFQLRQNGRTGVERHILPRPKVVGANFI